MATGNFYNHENGIFILHEPTKEESIKEIIEYWEIDKEDITDQNIWDYQNSVLEIEMIGFQENLQYLIEKYGYTIFESANDSDTFEIYNKVDKIIAKIYFMPGYYSGVQVIVETSPEELISYWNTESELYEQYSPHNKRLLKAVSKLTKHLGIYARFSNGETWYSEV